MRKASASIVLVPFPCNTESSCFETTFYFFQSPATILVGFFSFLFSSWRIQDFPQMGAPTLMEFAKFSPKLHEIGRIWIPREGRVQNFTMCCDMGQNDTIGKIELNPSFVLSSNNTNYKNDIQLFPQLFDELCVNGDYH